MPEAPKVERNDPRKAAPRGFKHTAKPASVEALLHAFGLKKGEYERSKAFVHKHVNKEPAHAR